MNRKPKTNKNQVEKVIVDEPKDLMSEVSSLIKKPISDIDTSLIETTLHQREKAASQPSPVGLYPLHTSVIGSPGRAVPKTPANRSHATPAAQQKKDEAYEQKNSKPLIVPMQITSAEAIAATTATTDPVPNVPGEIDVLSQDMPEMEDAVTDAAATVASSLNNRDGVQSEHAGRMNRMPTSDSAFSFQENTAASASGIVSFMNNAPLMSRGNWTRLP